MWIYVIETGELWRRTTSGKTALVSTGYAGRGEGLNNPAMCRVKMIGPLPPGWYEIGPQYHHKKLGRLTFNLTPAPHTEMFGRSLFRIHGDNKKANKSASNGCIVLDYHVRGDILNAQTYEKEHRLHVVISRQEEGLNL